MTEVELTINLERTPEHELAAVKGILEREQKHDRYHHSGETVSVQLARVLDHKRSLVASCIQQSRLFQEDVLTFLRAFSLMLETVASAATHGEKAARLRGLMELVETAARKVRDRQFRESETWVYGLAQDVFHCDYPLRHWMDRCRDAEAKAEEAEARAVEVEARMKKAEDKVAAQKSETLPESTPETRAEAAQEIPF